MSGFDAWCLFLGNGQGVEGGLSLDPADSGNYTPDGRLVGSNFGISAHSYPHEDIPGMTLERANFLRKRDFYDKVRGDEVPPPVAFVLSEAAYGSGPERAIEQLQAIVGARGDGDFGRLTMDALNKWLARKDGVENLVVEFQAQRLLFEASLEEKWDHNKVGWSRRLFHATAHAMFLAGVPIPVVVTVPIQPGPFPLPAMLGEGTFTLDVQSPDRIEDGGLALTITVKRVLDAVVGPQGEIHERH